MVSTVMLWARPDRSRVISLPVAAGGWVGSGGAWVGAAVGRTGWVGTWVTAGVAVAAGLAGCQQQAEKDQDKEKAFHCFWVSLIFVNPKT